MKDITIRVAIVAKGRNDPGPVMLKGKCKHGANNALYGHGGRLQLKEVSCRCSDK